MVVSYILLIYTIAITYCSIILPFIEIQSKLLRRILKTAIVALTVWLCVLHVQSKYKIEPYTPAYNPTVYVTDHGDRYHTKSCGYLWNSSNGISLYSATTHSYYPCAKCDPPIFSDEIKDAINTSLQSAIPDFSSFVRSPQFVCFLIATAVLLGIGSFFTQKLPCFNSKDNPTATRINQSIDYAVVLFALFYLPGLIAWVTSSVLLAIAVLVLPELLWWVCSRAWDKWHQPPSDLDK